MSVLALNILVVDDDKIQRFTTQKLLESCGYPVSVAAHGDGEAAFNYLRQTTQSQDSLPGLIFLDINMPVMNGWQFLDAFKAWEGKDIPVIIVSSSADPVDLERATQYKMVSKYLVKPVSKDIYRAILEYYADK